MRKLIVPVLALFVLLPVGAALAQGPEMQPPGPTVQKSPGLTNNNLPNPNSADEQKPQPLNTQTTTPVDTTTQTTTTTTTTMDDPADTTTNTADTMDTTTDTADSTTLPATGSKLPLVGLVGLLALAGAVVIRRF